MPPTTRKPTAIRRREIAVAALRLIDEEGIRALTSASLARAVGLTPGALFRHFASIDEILSAAVDVAIESAERTFPSGQLPPVERLRSLVVQRIALLRDTPGVAWLLLSDQVQVTVPEDAVERLRGLVQRSRAFLLDGLREGIASGELRQDLSPEQMLPILAGTVHSLVAGRGVHGRPDAPAPDTVVDALFVLLTHC